MLSKLTALIYQTGDWNHAIIGVGILIIISLLTFLGMDPRTLGYIAAIYISGFYHGKEHRTFIHLGEIKSLNPMLWAGHDKRQTFYMWGSVWIYAITFDKFIYSWVA